MSCLNIVSLNVRGLRDYKKRKSIYMYLKKKNADFVFLQETHCCTSSENQWRKEWGGNILFSHGSNNSKGVAILIKPNANCKIDNVVCDTDGRYILVRMLIDNQYYYLLNTYFPNTEKDQIIFLDHLCAKIDNVVDREQLIMGGDINIAIDPIMDRRSKNKDSDDHKNSRIRLKRFLLKLNLVDIFRVKNPHLVKYTCQEIINENLLPD